MPKAFDPSITAVRIYRTTAGGGTFYRVGDVPAGVPSFNIGDGGLGEQAKFNGLDDMPAGVIVRYWNGRLLTAKGRTLRLSEPMAYHLSSPRHGFVQRPERITLVAPTDGALFIATTKQTLVLTGRQPEEWVVSNVDAGLAVPHSDISVSLDSFSAQWAGTSAMGAVWLTTHGYVFGLPDGSVISPQTDQLRLSPYRRGATVLNNRRISTYCQ